MPPVNVDDKDCDARTDYPNIVHGSCTVQGVKGLARTNKQGSLNVLLLETLRNGVNGSLRPSKLPRTRFHRSTHLSYIPTDHAQDRLCHQAARRLTNADWRSKRFCFTLQRMRNEKTFPTVCLLWW